MGFWNNLYGVFGNKKKSDAMETAGDSVVKNAASGDKPVGVTTYNDKSITFSGS